MVIPFEEEYRKKFYELEDQIFDSNFWSEGNMLRRFEEDFGRYVKNGARAVTNCGTGLYTVLEYVNVRGYDGTCRFFNKRPLQYHGSAA